MSSRSPTPPQEPTPSRLVGSLAVAGFLSGLIIIGIYVATLDTITENKARELREAVFRVLPEVTQMQKLQYDGERVVLKENGKDDENTLYAGYDDKGNLAGYALASDGPGFQDTIRVLFGYQPANNKVVGMWVLESRETPGLGDKIYKDAAFVTNFDNLSTEPPIVTVKRGTRSRANEVDAITGATISSKAVVRIINQGVEKWHQRLPLPGNEPQLKSEGRT
ncbi:MAG: RnfABCDGE type electron transport complex subunit G [Gammaproteobacteria bacterium]|nr:RnfABCDGE type electron transport complex subunit G [Gammaproteobacteria bacterium]MCW8992251.1 RnfABCDGE type electron transport complex subunit G [Gammaproteobacteria bacterium]